MRRLCSALTVLALALVLLAPPVAGQDRREVELEVFVSSATTASVFIDAGSDAGIAVGDRVFLYPAEGPSIEGVVRAVATSSARVEPLSDLVVVAVGTRGEVRISLPAPVAVEGEASGQEEAPAAQSKPRRPPDPEPLERPVTEHPPWRRAPEEWNLDTPLLAPPASTPFEEREPLLSGRVFTSLHAQRDGLGAGRESAQARTGLDLLLTNPFDRGGELFFDGEASYRTSDTSEGGTVDNSRVRLERLSYLTGGRSGDDQRLEFGRFHQRAFPEFGRIDGLELAQRIGGATLGVSAGLFPEPNDSLDTGDDWQAAVFYTQTLGEERLLEWRAGYQKTWHSGHSDRDLFVFGAGWRPGRRTFLRGTAWVDSYTTGDAPKDDGLELTRLQLVASSRNQAGDGFRVHFYENRWPLLLRNEFTPPAEDPLLDETVTRLGMSVWTRTMDHLRLSGRADHWEDEDDSGLSAEARADLRRLLPGEGDLGVAVFTNAGSFSDTAGVRLSARWFDAADSWDIVWEIANVEEDTLVGGPGELLQHDVRVGYDTRIFDDWSLSLDAGVNFGDQQDSASLSLFLQRRF